MSEYSHFNFEPKTPKYDHQNQATNKILPLFAYRTNFTLYCIKD